MQPGEENSQFPLKFSPNSNCYVVTDRILENFDPATDNYTINYYCRLILSIYANYEWYRSNINLCNSIIAFRWIWGFFLSMITIEATLGVSSAEIVDDEDETILKWVSLYLVVFLVSQYVFNGKRFWREFPRPMVTIGADSRLGNIFPFSTNYKSYKFNVEPESSHQFLGRLQIVELRPQSLEGVVEYKYKLTGVRWFHILHAFAFAVVFIHTNLTNPQEIIGNHHSDDNDENSDENDDENGDNNGDNNDENGADDENDEINGGCEGEIDIV